MDREVGGGGYGFEWTESGGMFSKLLIKQEKKIISPKTLPFYYNFQIFVLASMLKIQHSLNVCSKMYVCGEKDSFEFPLHSKCIKLDATITEILLKVVC